MTVEEKQQELDKLGKEPSNEPNPRDALVNSINAARVDEVNSEILQSGVTVEPMHEKATPTPDPLAAYIQKDEAGEPLFKMTVDGQEVLVPLAQIQKERQLEQASRKRMNENADWSKNLAEREDKLRLEEAALQSRFVAEPLSGAPDVEKLDFKNEAREIFNTLIDDDAEVASDKLASVLSGIASRTSSQTPINAADLVNQTREAIRKEQAEKDAVDREAEEQQQFQDGYKAFEDNYPHLAKDPELFAVANSHTNIVSNEHPEWGPVEVILEAAARTDKWLNTLKGAPLTTDANINNRQQQKDNLVAMPASRTAAREAPPTEEAQTPSDALRQVREARGQP